MKKILFALATVAVLGGPIMAQEQAPFTLKKGAVVAEDFGTRLSRSELRKELKARGITSHKFFGNRGNLFVINDARWQGKGYRLRVDRTTGAISWFFPTDGLYSVQKF